MTHQLGQIQENMFLILNKSFTAFKSCKSAQFYCLKGKEDNCYTTSAHPFRRILLAIAVIM